MHLIRILFALAVSGSNLLALSPKEIIRSGEKQMRGQNSQAHLRMTVKRPDYNRVLSLRVWTVGGEKALVEILSPAKERGVLSLRSDRQMWNYLPKTDQTVKVPSSLMLQSWMGSDFTNDDLMKASSLSKDYHHKVIKEEQVTGQQTDLIECLPKRGAPVVWGKVRYWARKSDHLPVKQEFFDEEGKLVRTLAFKKFKKMDDRIVPTRIQVTKKDAPGETTQVDYESLLYDRKVDVVLFNRHQIRRTSQLGLDMNSLKYAKPMKEKSIARRKGRRPIRLASR